MGATVMPALVRSPAHPGQQRPEGATAVRYTLHWGRDNARRISSVADLEGLLSFLTTVRGREGAPHGVDLMPAGAAGGGLQIGVGHPHRGFVVWLDADANHSIVPGHGGSGTGDALDPWPEPVRLACGAGRTDLQPARAPG